MSSASSLSSSSSSTPPTSTSVPSSATTGTLISSTGGMGRAVQLTPLPVGSSDTSATSSTVAMSNLSSGGVQSGSPATTSSSLVTRSILSRSPLHAGTDFSSSRGLSVPPESLGPVIVRGRRSRRLEVEQMLLQSDRRVQELQAKVNSQDEQLKFYAGAISGLMQQNESLRQENRTLRTGKTTAEDHLAAATRGLTSLDEQCRTYEQANKELKQLCEKLKLRKKELERRLKAQTSGVSALYTPSSRTSSRTIPSPGTASSSTAPHSEEENVDAAPTSSPEESAIPRAGMRVSSTQRFLGLRSGRGSHSTSPSSSDEGSLASRAAERTRVDTITSASDPQLPREDEVTTSGATLRTPESEAISASSGASTSIIPTTRDLLRLRASMRAREATEGVTVDREAATPGVTIHDAMNSRRQGIVRMVHRVSSESDSSSSSSTAEARRLRSRYIPASSSTSSTSSTPPQDSSSSLSTSSSSSIPPALSSSSSMPSTSPPPEEAIGSN